MSQVIINQVGPLPITAPVTWPSDRAVLVSVSGSVQDLNMSFNQLGTGYAPGWPAAVPGWYGFRGQIDEVRIWSVARTPAEIAAAVARASP